MPSVLEIHHIDVGQGDSTLILVRDQLTNNIQRSVLIDAGLHNQGQTVHNYLNVQGVTDLNIMMASHYDRDHYRGLRWLLNQSGSPIYNNVRIYDRGEGGQVDRFGHVSGRNREFDDYANAAQPLRTRPTARVIATLDALVPLGWLNPYWLIEQNDLLGLVGGVAPTMRCIAANQYVAGTRAPVGGRGFEDNPLSLGFIIKFNNFRYYTAGDIETEQEEAVANKIRAGGADHVCALKVSHHGSDRSTSQTFVNRMCPRVAFISCGNNNGHDHRFGHSNLQEHSSNGQSPAPFSNRPAIMAVILSSPITATRRP